MSPQLIKLFVIIVAAVTLFGVGTWIGYDYRDGKAAKEALALQQEKQKEIDELQASWNQISASYENTITELRNKKPRVITKIVEKEIEKSDYSCVLPDSGLQSHRDIIETLRNARNTGKFENEVPGAGTTDSQK